MGQIKRRTSFRLRFLAIVAGIGTLAGQTVIEQQRERRSVDHSAEPGRLGSFLGMRWTPPPSLRATESWTVCPLRCVVYEGPEPGSPSRLGWPLLVVFEPFLSTAEEAIDHWVKARIETSYDPPQSRSPVRTLPFRPRQGRLVGATFGEGGNAAETSGILIAAWERDGVSVPIAIWAHRPADWNLRGAALSALLDTLTVDRARIQDQQTALALAIRAAEQDIDAARVAGGVAQMYFGMDLMMRGGIATGAAAPMPTPEDAVAIFLPGGVFVPFLPPSLAKLDLASVFLREAPPRWRREGRDYVVTYADGRVERYQALADGRLNWRKSAAAAQLGGLRSEIAMHPVKRTAASQLAGTYRYSRSFAAYGFDMGATPPMVAMGGRERTLVLRPDGAYLLTGMSTAGASGSPVLARRPEAESGQWSYDPATWMLQLQPTGRPLSSSPAFDVPFQREAAGGDEWVIFGATWLRVP